MRAAERLAAPSELDRINAIAATYVAAFQTHGAGGMAANLVTRVETRRVGDRLLPMTINRSEPTGTYVCSPQTAYIRYAREEVATLPTRRFDRPLGAVIGGFDRLLRAARIDDIVHLNNWMLSTNLTGGLRIARPAALTSDLAAEFPDSVIAIRSLNRWSDAALIDSLVDAGWNVLPSRQIYVIDDPTSSWLPRRDTRRDQRLAENTPLRREEIVTLTDADATRIAELYHKLYCAKYSALNPDFTPLFIRTAHEIGMLRTIVYRGRDGIIQSVVGLFQLGDTITTPIVGYDTAVPAEAGLYRLASFAILSEALRLGLKANLSSGAADFKRSRGARPEIEYTAVYIRHLPRARRAAIGLLRHVLTRIGVPLMRRYGL